MSQAEPSPAPEHSGPEHSGPEHSGPEHSGPEHSGPEHSGKDWDLAEGDEIVPGRYALESLGGGYDFEAFLAWDDHLCSIVVAKLVRPHLVEHERTLASLAREAEMLAGLSHPFVVRGFGAVLDGPRPHLVMEHLEGPTLASTIRHFGGVEVVQLVPLAFQIASALQYLSNEHVVHLDVKPRNIILGVPPRLIDLSVARSFERARRITGTIGTDAYMAPEQCDPGLAEIGSPADVWGLGATLHHSVAAGVPFPRAKDFDRENRQARFPQLHQPPQTLPAHVPAQVEELILDCLEFEPSKRPTPADVATSLEPLIEGIKRGRILGRGRPRIR